MTITDFIQNNLLEVAVMSALLFIIFNYYRERMLPRAHNVALLGFPKSGKTTTIIVLFGNIFEQKLENIKAAPRGDETIDRINRNLKNLKNNIRIPPTTIKSEIPYIADLSIGRLFLKRNFKLQIGDFKGSRTLDYSEKNDENRKWFHKNREFNEWNSKADAFVFFIDIGKYLLEGPKYVLDMETAIRAAWQKIVDLNSEQLKKLVYKPVILLFSKCDLLNILASNNISSINELNIKQKKILFEIRNKGFKKLPKSEDIEYSILFDKYEELIINDFKKIIRYLKAENRNFHRLFVSNFGLENGIPINLRTFVRILLPTSPFLIDLMSFLKMIS